MNFIRKIILKRIWEHLDYNDNASAYETFSWYKRIFGFDSYAILTLAHCLIFEGSEHLFIKQLRIVYRFWSESSEYYSLKGRYYLFKKNYNRAIDSLNIAINLDPEHPSLYNNRGYYKSKLGLHEEAIRDFDTAIELDGKHYYAYNNRGYSKLKLGQQEAIQDIDFSINHQPNNAVAYKNKALWELEFGEKSKITPLLKRAYGKKFFDDIEEEMKEIISHLD